jgi:hypothetical protein
MLRDHAPKKAGFQHWPVSVADFNSHVARRLAGNMIASQVGEGLRRLEAEPRAARRRTNCFHVLAATGAKLSDLARLLFGQIPGGWQRVQDLRLY